jgi:hypothetical protein
VNLGSNPCGYAKIEMTRNRNLYRPEPGFSAVKDLLVGFSRALGIPAKLNAKSGMNPNDIPG